ncbi:hypothetical protein [Brachybacterium aquaticum]|uniref:hypothetical protein n=1 Tax=Brachybacterium aquaticum TaxID=1432564 RepID=UPI001C88473D
MNRAFEALLKKAKLRRVKLHDLRHTCASLLLAEGVPLAWSWSCSGTPPSQSR